MTFPQTVMQSVQLQCDIKLLEIVVWWKTTRLMGKMGSGTQCSKTWSVTHKKKRCEPIKMVVTVSHMLSGRKYVSTRATWEFTLKQTSSVLVAVMLEGLSAIGQEVILPEMAQWGSEHSVHCRSREAVEDACVHSVYSCSDEVSRVQFARFTLCFSWIKWHMSKSRNWIKLRLFPNISVVLEQICIFKSSVTTELTVCSVKTYLILFLSPCFSHLTRGKNYKFGREFKIPQSPWSLHFMGEETEAQRGCNLTKVSPCIRSLVSGFPNILFTPPISKVT